MIVNMGPQHPSTHGVLRLVLELDGETVVSASPTIGYLPHRHREDDRTEKVAAGDSLVERMDYLSAQSNSMAFCLSVSCSTWKSLSGCAIFVLIAELQRINSHLVWLARTAWKWSRVGDALLLPRTRAAARTSTNCSPVRIARATWHGGSRRSAARLHDAVRAFLDRLPSKLDEYEDLLSKNEIYLKRTRGVGVISKDDAVAYGLVGPIARAAGVDYDVRKYFPYLGYDTYEFNVPVQSQGDVYARYQVRIAEMRESLKLCRQALERISPTGPFAIDDPRITPPPKDRLYTEMEALIQHFLIYSQGFTVPAGEAYVPVEGPRGEHGFSVVSDGTNRPWRIKSRAPSLLACQALERLVVGGLIADVIAVIGSIDVVMGDVDRDVSSADSMARLSTSRRASSRTKGRHSSTRPRAAHA
jgi:NADH-quinone oxidoreductase subunit D